MGLNKRFISDESILSAGSRNFEDFNRYMTNWECYASEGEYAPSLFDLYITEKEVRENIWRILNSKCASKVNIIGAISICWKIVNSEINVEDPEELTLNYFDHLISTANEYPDCPPDDIFNVISFLKRKIK